MKPVRILVERVEDAWVATAFDEAGVVASAAKADRQTAVNAARRKARQQLGECRFVEARFGQDDDADADEG